MTDSRRRFLSRAAGAGIVALFADRLRADAEEPFDSVPERIWKNQRRNGLIMIRRPAPASRQLSWSTRITNNEEPGEALTVAGRVFAPDGTTPAAGVTVYAYNTDAKGYYDSSNHGDFPFPPRIYGWMKTDAGGRFELLTVRPGCYPNMRVPAHIHFCAWGAGYPLQWVDDLRFEGDSFLTPEMIRESVALGEFATIRPVVDGRCEFKIRLGSEMNFV